MNDFAAYKKLGDREKYEKAENWEIALGLQEVDGLKPSPYLIELAKKNIEGELTMDEVKAALKSYYDAKALKDTNGNRDNATVNATVNNENATLNLSRTQTTILELLKGNPKLTLQEISETLVLNISTIKRAVKVLKEKHLITRVGADKTGYWKILF